MRSITHLSFQFRDATSGAGSGRNRIEQSIDDISLKFLLKPFFALFVVLRTKFFVKKLFVSRPDRALVRARAAQAALELALRLAQGKVPAGTQALTAAQQSDDEALAALDEAFVR